MFLKAILYCIFTVGGIIEREHIPPKHPWAWRPSWHPQNPRLFNYHPSRGPSRTLHQQTTRESQPQLVRWRPPPSLNKSPDPASLFTHAGIKKCTHTLAHRRCTHEHKHWKHTLLTSPRLSTNCFSQEWTVFCFNGALWFVGKGNLLDWGVSS